MKRFFTFCIASVLSANMPLDSANNANSHADSNIIPPPTTIRNR